MVGEGRAFGWPAVLLAALAVACGDGGAATDSAGGPDVPADGAADPGPADLPMPDRGGADAGLDAADAGPPPRVVVIDPPRGTFATACDQDLPVRLQVDSDRPVIDLRLQGAPLAPAAGTLDAAVRPVAGLNRLEARAKDDLGREARGHRAFLCGTYAPPGDAVVHAADLYLGLQALDALSTVGARAFDAADLTALFAARSPLYASSLLEVLPGPVTHDPGTVLRLLPGWGQVGARVEVPALRAAVAVELIGSPSRFYDVAVSADRVEADLVMTLTVDPEGTPRVDLGEVAFAFPGLAVEVSGVADDLLAVYPEYRDTIVGFLEDFLADEVRARVPALLAEALGKVSEPFPVSFLDTAFRLRLVPSLAEASPYGIRLGLDVAVLGLAPDPGVVSPGVLHTPGQEDWPTVDGIRLSVKDDLLNAVLHEAWRAGLLRVAVDQAFLERRKAEVHLVAGFLGDLLPRLPGAPDPESPIAVDVSAPLPPVASLDLPLRGGVRLGIGDLRLSVRRDGDGSAPLLDLDVTVAFEGEVASAPGGVLLDLHRLEVDLDVVDDGGALRDAESYLEGTTLGLLEALGPTVSGILGTIPLPAIPGMGLQDLHVGTQKGDGGLVVVEATLVAAGEATP